MNKQPKYIRVFEHQTLKLNQDIDGYKIDEKLLTSFENHFGTEGVPYFSLIKNGVKFNQFVGVIQIGNTTIEILPKADNSSLDDKDSKAKWQKILIDMLLSVGIFDVQAPSSSSLKIKPNSILDLYIGLFIQEVEYLLHTGLIKKYRKTEGNSTALKGNLQFGKHIQHNLVHQERFYVRHTTYDKEHFIHFILFKTIKLLRNINTNNELHSHIGALMLNFPEMPDISVTENSFERIMYDRKTLHYKKALEIARLLLLQYHPDVNKGQNHVLALMFDMNLLWEKFVYTSLRKQNKEGLVITAQTKKSFWQPESGYISKIKPDIVIKTETETIVLDTKWKNLNGYNPSADDLRQMYVYHDYYNAKRVALVYPSTAKEIKKGVYLNREKFQKTDKECSIISITVNKDIKKWQDEIKQQLIADFFKIKQTHA